MIIVLVCRVDAHHGECLAWAGLAIGEDGGVVALETVDSAFLANLLEYIILGVVVADGVKCKPFAFVAVEGLDGMCVFFDIDADSVIL